MGTVFSYQAFYGCEPFGWVAVTNETTIPFLCYAYKCLDGVSCLNVPFDLNNKYIVFVYIKFLSTSVSGHVTSKRLLDVKFY